MSKVLTKKDTSTTIYFIGSMASGLKTAMKEQDWDKVAQIQNRLKARYEILKEKTECFDF